MQFQKQPKEVQAVSNLLNTFLRWKGINGPPRGYEIYHPSAFGGCLRKMQYQRYVERGKIEMKPSPFEAKTIRIFDTGHSMHDRWAKYWEDLGVLRGVWECTNPVCQFFDDESMQRRPTGASSLLEFSQAPKPRKYGLDNKIGCFKPKKCACGNKEFKYHEIMVVDEEMNFRGHVDQILDFSEFPGGKQFKEGNPVRVLFKDEDLPKKPFVVDMKSINSFGYKSKLESGAPFNYKVQVTIYIHLLDLEYGILYFENKDDSSTKLVVVERNDELWAKIKEQSIFMNEMADDLLLPPPRPKTKDSFECKYCDFRSICQKKSGIWDDPDLGNKRLAFYGGFS